MNKTLLLVALLAITTIQLNDAFAVDKKVKEKTKLNNNEEDAIAFLEKYNVEYSQVINTYILADWEYNTNITEYNANQSIAAGLVVSAYSSEAFQNASQFDPTNFTYDTQRQLASVGQIPLSDEEMANLSSIKSQMSTIYGEGKVCHWDDPTDCYPLEPDLTNLFARSHNYSILSYTWEQWRNNVGRPLRPLYLQYVELSNKLAQANGYSDYGDMWRQKYETDTFEQDMYDLYEEMRPLYELVHAYIRRKLYDTYGAEVIDLKGALPACVLGDMWGRFWTNLNEIATPFPDKPSVDPTPEMIAQNYTEEYMFRLSDDFYMSMGLLPEPQTFWKESMLVRPTDGREVVCHATAWDFFDGKDFRIKMCSQVLFDDFLTIHHEMGHNQYQMQYAFQPVSYKDGANDGFHEAVGEVMAMSVATPKHLYTLGLLDELFDDEEMDINFLLKQSLNTITTLPFHLINDKWRWEIFRGGYDVNTWNDLYWQMKYDTVGVVPPVSRDPNMDLDPPTIFHISGDYDMIRYFTRTIMQFQFAEALCLAANHTGPLYKCDFYGSHAAGDKLAAMLQMGRSRPWPDAMEALTGQREMLVGPIQNYFSPLEDYIIQKLIEWGDGVGWGDNWIPAAKKYPKHARRILNRRHL